MLFEQHYTCLLSGILVLMYHCLGDVFFPLDISQPIFDLVQTRVSERYNLLSIRLERGFKSLSWENLEGKW